MRTSIIAASLALISYAAAQGTAGLPQCAQKCLEPFANEDGIAGCPPIDIPCICSGKGFLNLIGCCLLDECSETDQQTAITFAANICKSGGVTVPSQITCDKSQSGSTSVDSAALSSTVSSISSAISSATSAISESVSSRSESSESVASTLSDASSALTASATTTSGGGVATSAASAASSAAASATGAAVRVAVGGSGVFGGVLAALALL